MTDMTKVLYVPLDDRPCNYHYPLMLADICDDIQMIAPPFELMGKLKVAADTDKIWEWLFENAQDAEYAILSVDTLVYGNIIHSRIHQRTYDEINAYLENFRKLKDKFPQLKIHAFNLVARVAGYDSSFEDPDYWQTHGFAIWRYGVLNDKIARCHASEEEVAELEKITASIPQEYLDDFLARREKDRYVNHKSVDFTKDGVFDRLVVPKDDTAEYGYAATDQAALSKKLLSERLMDKVMVYPGADEVGSVMFTRVFNIIKNFTPKVFTKYSSILGPTIIPRYEDRPIAESLKAQITSMGGLIVTTPQESDFLFAVNSPGKAMEECWNQQNKDLTFTTHTNLHEFFNYIKYYKTAFRKPVALSDVAFCNGADIEMMIYANKAGILEIIDAYGGWNTCENTNGMCLAHANIQTYYLQHGFAEGKQLKSTEFLAMKIFEDYLFQAVIIPEAVNEVSARYPGRSAYKCADIHDEIANYMGERLRELIKVEFNDTYKGFTAKIGEFKMPWDRVYELHFSIKLD